MQQQEMDFHKLVIRVIKRQKSWNKDFKQFLCQSNLCNIEQQVGDFFYFESHREISTTICIMAICNDNKYNSNNVILLYTYRGPPWIIIIRYHIRLGQLNNLKWHSEFF